MTYSFPKSSTPVGPRYHQINPFGITETARLNALNTMELVPLYRSEQLKTLRTQRLKLLHSQPWETIEEEVINPDHWWPPVSAEARSARGTWMTYYPLDTKLAKIVLSIDWHAYEGDPLSPRIEWTIDTPASEYHPGKHYGVMVVLKAQGY